MAKMPKLPVLSSTAKTPSFTPKLPKPSTKMTVSKMPMMKPKKAGK